MEALFCRIEIAHSTNYKYKNAEDGKYYIGEVEIIGYFDINEKPIKETFKPIDVREIQKDEKNIDKPKIDVEEVKVVQNKDKNLDYEIVKNPKNSYYLKVFAKKIVGGGIGGGLGAGLGLILVVLLHQLYL